jgi:hypothetical protein
MTFLSVFLSVFITDRTEHDYEKLVGKRPRLKEFLRGRSSAASRGLSISRDAFPFHLSEDILLREAMTALIAEREADKNPYFLQSVERTKTLVYAA